MDTLIVAAVALPLLVTALGLLLALRGWWRGPTHPQRPVVVHLDDGTSLRGVVSHRSPAGLVLFDVVHLESGGTRLAGDVLCPRRRILFVQSNDG